MMMMKTMLIFLKILLQQQSVLLKHLDTRGIQPSLQGYILSRIIPNYNIRNWTFVFPFFTLCYNLNQKNVFIFPSSLAHIHSIILQPSSHLLILSLLYSCGHSSSLLFIHPFIYLFINSFIPLFILSFFYYQFIIQPFMYSFILLFILLFILSSFYSFILSFTFSYILFYSFILIFIHLSNFQLFISLFLQFFNLDFSSIVLLFNC